MNLTHDIHFIGIGGIGMSAIAKVLLRSGYQVCGSDLKENAEVKKLKELGATVYIGHCPQNVNKAGTVVFSSAIAKNNPELLEAKRRSIPILSRTEMLAELMRKKQSVVVAGAHGKTTTSALISTILLNAEYDPTVVLGGHLPLIGGNARIGSDAWFVAESDESDGSFLKLLPTIAVITNLDREHLNHYGSYTNLEQAFVDFANRVPFDGKVILCLENPATAKIIPQIEKPLWTYGLSKAADVYASDIRFEAEGTEFYVHMNQKETVRVFLPIPGRHNVLNALASVSVAILMGVSPQQIQKGLKSFKGIGRRLEKKGEVSGIWVMDDYAHHPTEIEATFQTLRTSLRDHKLKVLFQPHRYSRLADLWDEFVSAFDDVDEVIVSPVYGASERPLSGIDSKKLAEEIQRRGKTKAKYAPSLESGVEMICEKASEAKVLLTMGAGDVTYAGDKIFTYLQTHMGEGK